MLAALAAPTGDIAAAEDALADALERALRRWPVDGIPAEPGAWVITVARNRLRDHWRSAGHRRAARLDENLDVTAESVDRPAIPDKRLELMLVCAHPSVAVNVRTPLMLQVVMGVEAVAIAEAFAVEPATMVQRLVRAKRRIRDTGVPFTPPERDDLAERLPAVLEAVYGVYAIDWQRCPSDDPGDSLAAEAMHLTALRTELLPTGPEVSVWPRWCVSARRAAPARRGVEGAFVGLDDQGSARRDRDLIARAEDLLRRAHSHRRPGRFQYEAAIQSAHCHRPVDRRALRKLYLALLRVAPSLGAAVALAALHGEIDGPDAGLRALAAIDDPALDRFQPAWTTRARLLERAGRTGEANIAYQRALAITSNPALRAHLRQRLR